jgi:hypothetical protein
VVGIRFDQGGISKHFLAPNQAIVGTQLDNRFEELAKDVNAIALANTAQAGVVRQRLVQVVAEVPAHADAIGATRSSWRSERMPSKKSTSCSLKKTTGSIDTLAAVRLEAIRTPRCTMNGYAPSSSLSHRYQVGHGVSLEGIEWL